ncbi:hypothetical protein MYU51_019129 [Penicillium brevicompactum]|uniref:uncharacterized protein n=1 Tax=Penicillium brevicompactum TaxID=5074 RepID=UPI0025412B15|nr:uncharacterized protein N7506_006264 [Penicillium brevicompactum]KAJ5332481.1 hypothetical protein N7506_006264 [Penicillium brevicompactum]
MHGQSSVISVLLSMGAAVNAADGCGRTPLCWAAIRGHAGAVDVLLGVDGVEVDTQDMYLRTPLIWAAHNGHSSVVKLLMPRVNLDAKDKDGQTALSIATIMGHLDVNLTLYDVGKDVKRLCDG